MIKPLNQSLRQFVGLFRQAPPLSLRLLVPGMAMVPAFVVMAVWLGAGHEAEAFVTAFAIGLALRVGLRFESLVCRLLTSFSARQTLAMVVPLALGPLSLLIWLDDPLWCQRMQSLYFIILGSMFLSDVIGQRNDMAALFWPWERMTRYLPALTRMMALYHAAFLLLNETMIRVLLPAGWLVFWAVLPVISHLILSALIITVVDAEDSAARN